MQQSLSLPGWSTRRISLVSFLGILFFFLSKHLLVIIWGIVGIAERKILLKDGKSSKQYVRRDILYRWMNLFDYPIHPTTTITLKPANIPALVYNNYRNFVSSGAFDVSLQCFSSSKPWKILRKGSKGKVFERWPIFSGTTLLFDSMFSSRSVLRVSNVFYYWKHDKNGHTI